MLLCLLEGAQALSFKFWLDSIVVLLSEASLIIACEVTQVRALNSWSSNTIQHNLVQTIAGRFGCTVIAKQHYFSSNLLPKLLENSYFHRMFYKFESWSRPRTIGWVTCKFWVPLSSSSRTLLPRKTFPVFLFRPAAFKLICTFSSEAKEYLSSYAPLSKRTHLEFQSRHACKKDDLFYQSEKSSETYAI